MRVIAMALLVLLLSTPTPIPQDAAMEVLDKTCVPLFGLVIVGGLIAKNKRAR